jgi:SAM-dependent methyltransferase
MVTWRFAKVKGNNMILPKYRRSHHSMRQLYNWFHKFYGSIEKSLGPHLDAVIDKAILSLPDRENKTVLEYACGSGLLSLKLARLFKSLDGRDLSEGMINRAMNRARDDGITNVMFRTGNIIEPDEESNSYNYVFVSFALHLFSPEMELKILKNLLSIATDAVIIIDHGRKWGIATALVEWLEGGYYDTFIKQDFNYFAEMIGSSRFKEEEFDNCAVMMFWK